MDIPDEFLEQLHKRDPDPSAPEMTATWNTAAIRDLLIAALDDEELDDLCADHFRSVYEAFGSRMSKKQKIHRLLDHCVRHEQVDVLLRLVEERNPAKYKRFALCLSEKSAAVASRLEEARAAVGQEAWSIDTLEQLHKDFPADVAVKAALDEARQLKKRRDEWFREARAAIDQGDWSAIDTLEQLHKDFPADVVVKAALDEARQLKKRRDERFEEARAAVGRGSWSAIATLERLYEEFPGDEEVKVALNEARNRIPLMTWVVLGFLLLDACLISLCGWCLLKDQPGLIAYLGTLFTIAGTLAAILVPLVKVKPQIRFDRDNLRRLGTDRRWLYGVAGSTAVLMVITFMFFPLGWIGNCRPMATPASTPIATLTPTLTPTPCLTCYQITVQTDGADGTEVEVRIEVSGKAPIVVTTEANVATEICTPCEYAGQSATLVAKINGYEYREKAELTTNGFPSRIEIPTYTPTPTPDCSDVRIKSLTLVLSAGEMTYPITPGASVDLKRSDVENLVSLTGQVELSGQNAEICKRRCCWSAKINDATADEESLGCDESEGCWFSVPMSDEVHTIFLKLDLYGQINLFTIRING